MSSVSMRSRLVSASLWAILGELVTGGARALSYVVYAKLLSPTDFGLVGYSLLIISLFPLLIDNSLGLALMRRPNGDQRVYSTLFYLNVALAIVAILVLCLVSPWAADFAHDGRIALILPVLSTQLLFNSLCSVHMAIAQSRFQYSRLVPVRVISTACSLALGIPAALLGYGYWSLVFGSVAGAAAQMVAAQLLLRWRPELRFDRTVVRELSGFTSWVAIDMGVTWMVMSGGGFFLAFFLGARDLGLFRLSDRIDALILGSVMTPLIPVLYRSFCELSAERGASWRLFDRSVRILTTISLVIAGAVVVAARPLETIIGVRWHGVAEVIVLNAIADGISYTTLSAPSLLRAHGFARVVAILRIATVVAQAAVYPLLAPRGLVPFVLGKLALEIAIYIATFVVLRNTFAQQVIGLVREQIWQATVVSLCALGGWAAADGAVHFGGLIALTAGLAAFCVPLGAYLFLARRDILAAVLTR